MPVQFTPSASIKMHRARRASSARPLRLLTRRSSSIRSTSVNVMASSVDAEYRLTFQMLQSTRDMKGGRSAAHCRSIVAECARLGSILSKECAMRTQAPGHFSPSMVSWVPVVAYAVLIFVLSAQSHPERLFPSFLERLGDKILHVIE